MCMVVLVSPHRLFISDLYDDVCLSSSPSTCSCMDTCTCMCSSAHSCGCVANGGFLSIIIIIAKYMYMNPSTASGVMD